MSNTKKPEATEAKAPTTEGTEAKVTKPRGPNRTLEERIAELQAKAEAEQAKKRDKAAAKIADVEGKLERARARVTTLEAELAEVRKDLGLDTEDTDAGSVEVSVEDEGPLD